MTGVGVCGALGPFVAGSPRSSRSGYNRSRFGKNIGLPAAFERLTGGRGRGCVGLAPEVAERSLLGRGARRGTPIG